MRVSMDACCVGGPLQQQPPITSTEIAVLALVSGVGSLIVFAALAAQLF